jgi:predicted dehydrogenase
MKKFNVGIVGYGWVASAHIPAINSSPLAQVTAVCSSRALDAAELSQRHGSPIQVYNDLDRLLANPDIQVISLCGFPQHRLDQITRAASAGKHLIIEKPLALSLKDMRLIQKAVREAKIQVCVGFECRFSSQFLVTKATIDEGLLGKLHYGEVDYYHGIGPWYAQFRWSKLKAAAGSSLLDAGCHAMDALLLCLGDEVVEVSSYDTKSRSPLFAPYEFPSTSVSILKFKNGAVGKCTSCVDCLQPYYFHAHLVGSKGSLLDNKFHSSALGTDKAAWSTLAMKMLDSGDVSDHPYTTQFEAFFSALAKNKPMLLTNLEEAVKTHEAVFAADLSAELGRPVKISELREA